MRTDLEKLPPQEIEIEEALLADILLGNPEALSLNDPSDYYKTAHQIIFEALRDLSSRGQTPDIVSLVSYLKGAGLLEKAGGPAAISKLLDAPRSVNPAHHAERLRDLATFRRAIAICQRLKQALYDAPNDGRIIIEKFQSQALALFFGRHLNGSRPIYESVFVVNDQIEARSKNRGKIAGQASGIRRLDYLVGGFGPGDLVIIAARPSMGKTALALGMARHMANCGTAVAFYSLEMSSVQLTARMVSAGSGVNLAKFRTGFLSQDDFRQTNEASAKIHDLPVFINDESDLRPFDIIRDARQLKHQHNIGAVFIDYLQLMRGDQRTDRRDLEVGDISRSLKGLAKELQLPVFCLSQLNRKVEDRNNKRPRLSDLRESGAIEQDADIVAFIYRDEVYNERKDGANVGKAEIIVAKNRNGATGLVHVGWYAKTTSFYNLEETS